jgi:tetratricopeptide (TPR) repeat protein
VVNPGNVEAYAGLGELSRAGGDLTGAKASFEKALATSPSYSPALLGLADTEWDLGERASAQRHYRTLVSNASSPPERAKARAAGAAPTGGSTGTTAPAPTSTIKTLTSADLPPPAPPPKPAE